MAETKCGFNDVPGGATGKELLATYGPTLPVDTGASECCIDALLASQLNLPIVDRRNISGVGGTHSVNMYMGQVYVPTLNFTIYGAFAGVDLAAGGQPHKALIGRTFLQNFTMIYEGRTGTVTISSL